MVNRSAMSQYNFEFIKRFFGTEGNIPGRKPNPPGQDTNSKTIPGFPNFQGLVMESQVFHDAYLSPEYEWNLLGFRMHHV